MKRKTATPHLALIILGALLAAATTPRSSAAAEIEGVQFSDRQQSGETKLDLHCVGLLRYKLFIKAYVAALYLGPGVSPEDALADVPKRLELNYFWSISGPDFAKAGDHVLEQNVDSETLVRLRPRLDQINALYESVKPGDRYALTYVPGVGTELALNGHRKGIIPGADFAAAYFRIWLGERPVDTALRDQLLECSKTATDGGPPPAVASELRPAREYSRSRLRS